MLVNAAPQQASFHHPFKLFCKAQMYSTCLKDEKAGTLYTFAKMFKPVLIFETYRYSSWTVTCIHFFPQVIRGCGPQPHLDGLVFGHLGATKHKMTGPGESASESHAVH